MRDLGRVPYAQALDLQRRLQREVIESRGDDGEPSNLVHVLLLEHDPPVITVSRRPGARQHLLASDAQLHAAGVEVAETDRGGDITYHGPGQIVVYPIFDLNRFGLRIDSYMRFLEQMVIDTLASFDLEGERDATATGVWVRPSHDDRRRGAPAKICALGMRVSRWVTMHGLALNVATNLDHFNLIVPCGLVGRTVTSMQRELGAECPTIDHVKDVMAQRLITLLNIASFQPVRPITP
jgi:lipoyl(octanoyl) transferase